MPYGEQASRMLGVVANPTMTACAKAMLKVATDIGVADSNRAAPVGVHFGEPGQAADGLYFGGAGPRRTGCTDGG